MAEILKGNAVTAAINERTSKAVEELKANGVVPTLCIVRVGERPDDLSYENGAVKRAAAVGVEVTKRLFSADVTEEELISAIKEINADPKIHGVLMFKPLPKHINEALVCNTLAPEKDMDGITDMSMAGVYAQKPLGYSPCTAQAVIELLDHYGIELKGKNVTVIGRSLVIGKPVSMMLIKKNATVTICHTRTVDLPSVCRKADILVAAAGKAGMVTAEYVREGQVVIDVGINWSEEKQKIVGDVDLDEVSPIVSAVTPVPGGVGGVTTSVLMSHVAEAAERSLQLKESRPSFGRGVVTERLMLISIDRYSDINERKLMDLYAESNTDNIEYFFPDMEDKQLALRKVEEGFLAFLKDEFFSHEGNSYRILEENGEWVCALRLNKIKDGFYYVDALETHPEHRRKGYAVRLYRAVQEELKAKGDLRLCACVSKRNAASVKTHLKSGFVIAPGKAHDYLSGEDSDYEYGFEYRSDVGFNASVRLEHMTRERFHELNKYFEYDPDLFMDMELYEKCRSSAYDQDKVDAHFNRRNSDENSVTFAITLEDSVIGEVVLKHIDREHKQCELGIHLINDSVKGRGFGTEAEKLAIAYAFDELGMETILADSIVKNKRSQHILDKLGFEFLREEDGFRYYRLRKPQS